MSKRNMLLGLASGKLGDLVFYRDGGEQRTRPHVIPKNPRSQAQMAQRVRIANVSATYRLLKSVLADSFTGRPANQSGYNAFASSAIEISPFLTREMALADGCVPAPYVIARGTIAPVTYKMSTTENTNTLGLVIPTLLASDNNVASVSEKLLATYPQLQDGDMLTFVSIGYVDLDIDGGNSAFRGVPTIVSMRIDVNNPDSLPSALLHPAAGMLNFTAWDEGEVAAAAVVVSRVDGNGALQTSFATLKLSEFASESYAGYRDNTALAYAVDSYNVGEQSILRD